MRTHFKLIFRILLLTFPFIFVSSLDAGGWGRTKEECIYEDVIWNQVYFDHSGLDFLASVPNYSGVSLQGGMISIRGHVGENIGYLISTSFNPGFAPPSSVEEFVSIVQTANPDHLVTAVDASKLGAKFGVDICPLNPDDCTFWRFLSTENRLIRMGSSDPNENRRLYFFDSMSIR